MATLRAFPKGSTEPIEWTLAATEANDVERLTTSLVSNKRGTVTVVTDTGWLQIDLPAYSAIQIVK